MVYLSLQLLKRNKQLIGCIILFFIPFISITAQPIIEIKQEKGYYIIGTQTNIFVDETGTLSIQQILTPKYQKQFTISNQQTPNIGITEAALWCKLKIKNITNDACYFELFDAAPDTIALYEIISPGLIKIRNAGNYIPFKTREIRNNNYLFKLCEKTDSVKTFYVRIKNSRGTQFPITIGTSKGIIENHHIFDFLQGIYFGVMILMVLYNLCIYFSVRDTIYIYYVIYGTCMTIVNAALAGYGFEFLWPNHPLLNQYEDILTAALGISGIVFAINFLQTKQHSPIMHKAFIGLLAIFVVAAILVLLHYYMLATLVIEIASFVLILCFFTTALILLRKGYKPAKFFLFAWSILLLGVCVFVLKDFDVIPYNAFTVYSLQIGSALEAILLSFALADKINIYKKEKRKTEELHRVELLNNKLQIQQQTMQFIGREIHDSVTQKLTLASIYTQQMEFKNQYPTILSQLNGISEIINDSLMELRDLSKSLTESKIEHSEIAELLMLECERINDTGICKATLKKGSILYMSVTVKSFLLRTVQEFIQNSLKYADCKQINIEVTSNEKGIYLIVGDDGKGFDLDTVNNNGIGLNNMRTRIQIIGGTFNLTSSLGNGTTLKLFVPIQQLNYSFI